MKYHSILHFNAVLKFAISERFEAVNLCYVHQGRVYYVQCVLCTVYVCLCARCR